jgi:hypothetical protein
VRRRAPLWQLVDFPASVGGSERAGREAALEAAGLLGAWLSPDGGLQSGADGKPTLDVQALLRGAGTAPLGAWLRAAVPDGCAVPAATVSAVLAGIACAAADPGDCKAWIAPTGASGSARWRAPGPSRKRCAEHTYTRCCAGAHDDRISAPIIHWLEGMRGLPPTPEPADARISRRLEWPLRCRPL